MLIYRADTHSEMRADDPADREIIEEVGHDRVAITLTGNPRASQHAEARAAQLVRAEVELFF